MNRSPLFFLIPLYFVLTFSAGAIVMVSSERRVPIRIVLLWAGAVAALSFMLGFAVSVWTS